MGDGCTGTRDGCWGAGLTGGGVGTGSVRWRVKLRSCVARPEPACRLLRWLRLLLASMGINVALVVTKEVGAAAAWRNSASMLTCSTGECDGMS